MRMRSARLDLRDESGVSGVIVAISLVVGIGMLGLAVDGGFFLAKRRSMVNASDSAALAYGISCVRGSTDTTAQTDATNTATGNVSDATFVSKSGSCATGTVTLKYQGSQTRLFLPLLGISSSGGVTATASAAWGGAGGSVTPPIEVTKGGVQNCNFPGFPGPPPGPETQCTLSFPQSGNGQWGGVNTTHVPLNPAICNGSSQQSLLGWNVCGPPNGSSDVRPNCNGMSAADGRQAMEGNTLVTVNPSGTTWVCADNGQTNSVWNLFNNSSHLGKIFCFPITDDAKVYLDSHGSPKAYDVIAFIPLRVVQYFKQGNTLFLTLSWPGPQPCGVGGGGSSNFGSYQIGLSG
jgi:Flp pilus assembly protein TadG